MCSWIGEFGEEEKSRYFLIVNKYYFYLRFLIFKK